MFIGFKNHVCTNLCISTDGFLEDLRVMSVPELFNRVFQLMTRFDAERQLNQLQRLSEYALTEHQFAQLIGRARLYNYLPQKQSEKLPGNKTIDIPIKHINWSKLSNSFVKELDDWGILETKLIPI